LRVDIKKYQNKEKSQKQHENFWNEMIIEVLQKEAYGSVFFISAKTSNGNNLFLYTSLPPKHQNKLCSIKN